MTTLFLFLIVSLVILNWTVAWVQAPGVGISTAYALLLATVFPVLALLVFAYIQRRNSELREPLLTVKQPC